MHDLVGVLLGLTAALVWGTTDVVATLASRRVGSLAATAGTVLVSMVTLALLVLVTGTRLPEDPSVTVTALASGAISALAYLAFFTALRHGPITVVSPVVSLYGGLTVVLSVLLLGEQLAPLQAVGVVVATSGVVLAAVAFDQGIRSARPVGPGVAYALIALVAFAAVTILLSGPIRAAGWLPIMLLSRIANAGVAWVILGATRVARRRAAPASPRRRLDRRVARPARRGGPAGHRRLRRLRGRPPGLRDVAGRDHQLVRAGGGRRGRRAHVRRAPAPAPVAGARVRRRQRLPHRPGVGRAAVRAIRLFQM